MRMDLMGTLRFAHPTCLNMSWKREQSLLGLILCAGKQEEQIELLELDQSGIHVAEYLTALPTREILKEKLYKAIEISRQRLEQRKRSPEEQE